MIYCQSKKKIKIYSDKHNIKTSFIKINAAMESTLKNNAVKHPPPFVLDIII